VLVQKYADGCLEVYVLWRGPAEACVRHGFEDVQLGVDSGSQQLPVHPNRVGQKQVSGAGLQECGWKAG
jgi:hypothetical protein